MMITMHGIVYAREYVGVLNLEDSKEKMLK